MYKYKNLKSIAYNLGHSFLSLMNGAEGDYTIEHFYKNAKKTGLASIEIDFLNQIIIPHEFRLTAIIHSLNNYVKHFPRDVESQNCSMSQIKRVKIYINFDITKKIMSENFPDLEYATYECIVEILDDRGKIYKAVVPEWWRY